MHTPDPQATRTPDHAPRRPRLASMVIGGLLLVLATGSATAVGAGGLPGIEAPAAAFAGAPDPARGPVPPGDTAPRATPTNGDEPAAKRPNIVMITTDDQALTDMEWMPQTRRLLGDAGLRFTNAVSPHPLCCPARAEILTGQYAQNNGVRNNFGKWGGYGALRDKDNTLPAWLADTGYKTAFIGKYLNEYQPQAHGTPAGWTSWDPTTRGLYAYYHYTQWNNGHPIRMNTTHVTDYVAARTRDHINRWAGQDDPFFIWASYVAPHGACAPKHELTCWSPPLASTRNRHRYPGAINPALRSPAYNETDMSDKPPYLRNRGPVNHRAVAANFQGRIRSLADVDEAVASTLAALKATGELENTYVVFTTDNGFLLGQHRFVGKVVAYEPAVHIPLLITGPGITPGRTSDTTFTTIDLAPTIADLAGATVERTVDGRSHVDVLHNRPTTGAHTALDTVTTTLLQAGPISGTNTGPGWLFRGVRTGRYTYLKWSDNGFVELYDRARDPQQLRNVARDARYRSVRTELARRTTILTECSGDICRTPFPDAPAPKG